MTAAKDPVGVVGLGRMGSALAQRLIEAGWIVHGYDVRPERMATVGGDGFVHESSPAAVAANARRVLVSVFDDVQLIDATTGPEGILAGTSTGSILVDTSTVSPSTSMTVAAVCADAGAALVRATLSGNATLAANGSLGVFCSGPRDSYDQVADVLDHLAAQHVWLGEEEEARYAKIAINMMVIGTMVLMSEALAVASRSGIEQDKFLELMAGSVIASRFTDYKSEALRADDFDATMSPGDVRKDLGIALAAGRQFGVALPATATVDQAYALAEELDLGGFDFASVVLTHDRQRHQRIVRAIDHRDQ